MDELVDPHLAERFGRNQSAFHPEDCCDDSRAPQPPNGSDHKYTRLVHEYYETKPDTIASNGWLALPEFPTSSELLDAEDKSYLGAEGATTSPRMGDLPSERRSFNKVSGPYESAAAYLQTHYELLRCEALQPMRNAIAQVRENPLLGEQDHLERSIGIYDSVRIVGLTFSNMGLAARVCFSTVRIGKQVDWAQSKRLMGGSLLAMTPADDMFKTKAIPVTVAARPLSGLAKNPPEIDLFFSHPEQAEFDPAIEWVLVEERSAYFEASRHTMRALQHMSAETPFPLQKHIVNVETNVLDVPCDRPEDLTGPLIDLLDQSQRGAFDRILSKSIALVQGPPGTGKTHVSVMAVRQMLTDMVKGRDPPIIISCQTNHALDQFLNHIAAFEPSFARLGGQSTDQGAIKLRTMYSLREAYGRPQNATSSKAVKAAKNVEREMLRLLEPVRKGHGPLNLKVLEDLGIMTNKHAADIELSAAEWIGSNNTELSAPMAKWIGKHLRPSIIKPMPDFSHLMPEQTELEIEALGEQETESRIKEDGEMSLKGHYLPLSDNFICNTSNAKPETEIETILRCKDFASIAQAWRPYVYTSLQQRLKNALLDNFRKLCKDYAITTHQRRIGRMAADAAILANIKVVGTTTTGLSKYRAQLAALQPRIIMVEEAGESKEAPVTAACLPGLQQLILVGDHQQLRPHCNWKELEGRPWFLDVSLFERLVNNGIDYTILTEQRRMHPEIRRSLYPIYQHRITDHPSVQDRPTVPGMGALRTFFFSAESAEQMDESSSYFNAGEADMVVGFLNYLVINGTLPQRITVLTFYNGQRKRIVRCIAQHYNLRDHLGDIMVRTVDSYQGEEQDVVLLSLVRSNENDIIGFLSSINRACVALSRARSGMFCFGNGSLIMRADSKTRAFEQRRRGTTSSTVTSPRQTIDLLADKPSYFWTSFLQIITQDKPAEASAGIHIPSIPGLRAKSRAGKALPITCTKHNKTTHIQHVTDWLDNHGGCDQQCNDNLACGHRCLLRCHPFPHDEQGCLEACLRVLDCGHSCQRPCHRSCRCNEAKCLIASQKLRQEMSTVLDGEGPVTRQSYSNAVKCGTRELKQNEVMRDGYAKAVQLTMATEDSSNCLGPKTTWTPDQTPGHDNADVERTVNRASKISDRRPGRLQAFHEANIGNDTFASVRMPMTSAATSAKDAQAGARQEQTEDHVVSSNTGWKQEEYNLIEL